VTLKVSGLPEVFGAISAPLTTAPGGAVMKLWRTPAPSL
jgi:hypothetical protein